MAEFVRESDVQLGILTKRGNASVKSMAKVYRKEAEYSADSIGSFNLQEEIGCKGAQINGINTVALMMRLELYVDEQRWKGVG